MKQSISSENILKQISCKDIKLGDLRKVANGIKKDHDLALELWSSKLFHARLLAILIMDRKQLSDEVIDNLINDITHHDESEKLQLTDWLMANQLAKDKKTIALMESWKDSQSSLKRRVFWYYQARLRWSGQTSHANTEVLLSEIENKIENEEPEVQWAMNFLAGWIGIYDKKYRKRCIAFGERTGLYKDEVVAKNCTPNYLPKFIEIQVDKLNK